MKILSSQEAGEFIPKSFFGQNSHSLQWKSGGQDLRAILLVQNIYNFLTKNIILAVWLCSKETNEGLPRAASHRHQSFHQFICFMHRWWEVLWTNEHVFNDFEVNLKALLMPKSQRKTRLQMPSSSWVPGIWRHSPWIMLFSAQTSHKIILAQISTASLKYCSYYKEKQVLSQVCTSVPESELRQDMT